MTVGRILNPKSKTAASSTLNLNGLVLHLLVTDVLCDMCPIPKWPDVCVRVAVYVGPCLWEGLLISKDLGLFEIRLLTSNTHNIVLYKFYIARTSTPTTQ